MQIDSVLPRPAIALGLLAAAGVLAWQLALTPQVHLASSSGEDARARPATTQTQLSCEPLANAPGKVLTTLLVDFPPHAYTPAHRHPGAVSAFVVRGRVRSQMQGLPAQDYHAGQGWFEPPGELHLFAENPSASEPAQLLATFVTDEGCGPLLIPEDH
ncbi:Cupin domain protein [compost metagenome]